MYNRDKKLISKELVSFVMTRNCPYVCAHCLRGGRSTLKINKDVIDAALSQVKIDGVLHLSGGEPLLYTDMAKYLINRTYETGSKPKEVRFSTSGVIAPKKFEEFISVFNNTNQQLTIYISDDPFHENERKRLNKGQDNIKKVAQEYKDILNSYGLNFDGNIDDVINDKKGIEYTLPYCIWLVAIGRGKNIVGAKVIYNRNITLGGLVKTHEGYIYGNFAIQPNGILTNGLDLTWEEIDNNYDRSHNILYKPIVKILKSKKNN